MKDTPINQTACRSGPTLETEPTGDQASPRQEKGGGNPIC
jgi:hypothetical protein